MAASQNFAGYQPEILPVVLVGLGFTTCRLAQRLLLRPRPVFAVARNISRFNYLASIGLRTQEYPSKATSHLPKGATIVHTIPPLPTEELDRLHGLISLLQPKRLLYISSTSVYGDQAFVTAASAAAPSEPKGVSRVLEETWLKSQPWSNLTIRPAAIYGPGRGVHSRVREGKPPRAAGSGVVSRIHVDDLAAILDAGVDSKLEGEWPCADELPCSSDEIVAWCSNLLKIARPSGDKSPKATGRTVDGTAIRERLGLKLIYPDYHAGTLASLSEEGLGKTKTET